MNAEQYKYDVAFSFLQQDESLATQLNDLLQDRIKTFLYSKKQEEIAGTDGEQTFSRVFGEESRLVVVLYRPGWGDTPWTRIEKVAIRNRGFDHGYDFAIFIPLDDPPTTPEWLPKSQLWVGLRRWGVNGAASVIERRVQELGGSPHEETVQERASRLERALAFSEKRKQFLASESGVRTANDEFNILHNELSRLVVEIQGAAKSLSYSVKRARYFGDHIVILGLDLNLSVVWYNRFSNTLKDSELTLTVWEGHPPYPGIMQFDRPKQLQSLKFRFDLNPYGEYRWQTVGGDQRQFATKELAAFCLKYFMDAEQKVRLKKSEG